MTNKKRKGFTIVELVIVIAVIAILAGVLIPTFASIIDKANQSADIQAVRQMNVVLMAESVEDKPTDVNKVIEIVSKAGYNTVEKLTPKSNNHGFYWHSVTNTILLAKEGDTPVLVYPVDNDALKTAFSTGFLEKKGFYNLKDHIGIGGNESGSNEEPIPAAAAGLIEALTTEGKTGTITLDADIILSRDENKLSLDKVEIICTAGKADEPLVIDLNGHTLTIGIYASLVIEGNIKIINTANDADMDIIIPYTNENFPETGYDYHDYFRAFYVLEGGTLSLENLDIDVSRIGQMGTNIYNEGAVFLTNTDFTLNSAINFQLIAFENRGKATITGGSFVAKGTKVQSIKNYGQGTLEVTETSFKELTEDENGVPLTISYYGSTPLDLAGDEVIFNSVDVEIISENYCIDVKSPNFTINGGSYKGRINCSENIIIKIEGGRFHDGTAYVDFTKGVYCDGTGSEPLPISVNALDEINQIISFKYTGNTDNNLSIVATTTKTNDTTSKTTYAIFYKFYISEGINKGKALFGEDMNVDANESVTMYLNTQGLYIDSDIKVYGSLNVATGKINTVFNKNVQDEAAMHPDKVEGKIIVNEDAELTLNASMYCKVIDGKASNAYLDGSIYTRDNFVTYTIKAPEGYDIS